MQYRAMTLSYHVVKGDLFGFQGRLCHSARNCQTWLIHAVSLGNGASCPWQHGNSWTLNLCDQTSLVLYSTENRSIRPTILGYNCPSCLLIIAIKKKTILNKCPFDYHTTLKFINFIIYLNFLACLLLVRRFIYFFGREGINYNKQRHLNFPQKSFDNKGKKEKKTSY